MKNDLTHQRLGGRASAASRWALGLASMAALLMAAPTDASACDPGNTGQYPCVAVVPAFTIACDSGIPGHYPCGPATTAAAEAEEESEIECDPGNGGGHYPCGPATAAAVEAEEESEIECDPGNGGDHHPCGPATAAAVEEPYGCTCLSQGPAATHWALLMPAALGLTWRLRRRR